MGAIRGSLFIAALLLGNCGIGHAQGTDVGLVNQVVGDVSYASASGAGKVQAYMKMRQGAHPVIQVMLADVTKYLGKALEAV